MNSKIQIMLQQAIKAFQGGNLDSANLMLKRVLQVDSKNLPALHILGLIKVSQSDYKEAVNYLARAARINPNDASIRFNLAKALSDLGNDKEAIAHHKKAVTLEPNNPEAWLSYGKSLHNLGELEQAIRNFDVALNLNPNFYKALLNKSLTLYELGQYDESIAQFEKVLSLNPEFAEVWFFKGSAFHELGRYKEALTHYDQALNLKTDYAEALSNKGVVLSQLKLYDEAITHCNQALSLNPNYAEGWSNKGIVLSQLRRYDEAIKHFDHALSLNPNYAEGWSNKGNVLASFRRYDEAIKHFDHALNLNPNYAQAWSNKGIVLASLRRYDEAIAHYDKALSLKPDYAEGWSNKGIVLRQIRLCDEAVAHFDRALTLKSDIDWIHGDFFHTKMQTCNWSDFDNLLKMISKKVRLNDKVIQPFSLLSLIDDSLLHKKSSEIFTQDKFPQNFSLGPISKAVKKEKIRIGYFSPDFRNHPVAYLTAELFELHDRNRFEIIAFSFGIDDKTAIRSRLIEAFDQFIDITNYSDQEIAVLSRKLEIDIAVDLCGHTADARTGIFAHKAAPIQVSYIGYLGTMGAKYFDYIFADKTIIPHSSKHFYSEKIAYLPTYQVNDRKRSISDRQFTRSELGISQESIVFCCFNNNFKILPAIFDSWMRILKSVEGSVLFLYAENELSKNYLIKEANIRGIGNTRLVFGERIPYEEYLARYRVCDLFLDTFPYNAGTTASDALWAGLPVLTLAGQSFASRVAASLLNAIGLSELITTSQEEYEALAIELANNPQKLEGIKLRLAHNRLTTPLFDTPLFTKNLEAAYIQMYQRYQADSQPDHLAIV